MKRVIALLLLCALLLVGCGGQEQPEQTTPVDNAPENSTSEPVAQEVNTDDMAFMKLAIHNIYYLDMDARAADIADLHDKIDADVLLLQEVSKGWIPYINEYMETRGYSYYAYGRYGGEFNDKDLDGGDAFSPILWKTDKFDVVDQGHFWLSMTPDVVRSASWLDGTVSDFPRCNCWVILRDKQTGREIVVTSVHFDAYDDLVKLYSGDLLMQKMYQIAQGRPVIAGGDFNLPIEHMAYLHIAESNYLFDMRHQAVQSCTEGSWNDFNQKPDDDLGMGDHIFMTENVKAMVYDVFIEESYYDGKAISDHYPIVSEFYY